ATVILLPLTGDLQPLYTQRWSLRRPLAYLPTVGRFHSAAAKARKADVQARHVALRAERRQMSGLSYKVKMAGLLGPRLAAKAVSSWVRLRNHQLKKLRNVRQNPNHPLTKIPIKLVQWRMGDRAWRRLDPLLWRWELAYGPVIDKLKP